MNTSQFLGYLTAKYTHEIRNIISIIGESVGLMNDIIQMDNKHALKHIDKLSSSIDMIEKQLQRASDLSTHLNRLSHSPDRELDQVDLDQSVTTIVALAERIARQHELNLLHVPAENKIFIETKPLYLMILIHGLIQCGIQLARQGDDLYIGTHSSDGNISLFINFSNDYDLASLESIITDETQKMLEDVCTPLEASFSFCSEPPGIIVYLS